jgi:hypothetical protein
VTALVAVNLGVGGTLAAPVNVTVSDTISGNDIANGCILEVLNGSGAPITVTFVDPGHTAAGNTGTQAGVSVAAAAKRRFKPSAAFVDPVTNLCTVTYSSATTVTYELYT